MTNKRADQRAASAYKCPNTGVILSFPECTPVLGLAERGGKIIAKAVMKVTAGGVLNFILKNVNPDGATLMTDENNVYTQGLNGS